MVSRCGYFVKDKKLYCKVVQIEWNLGFTKEAKREYIKRVATALGDDVGKICDVTSASPDIFTRNLSPIYVKMLNSDVKGESVEDWIHRKIPKESIGTGGCLALMHYVYLTNLSEENIEVWQKYDCYSDVFGDPFKLPHNSQAASLGILKWLFVNNKIEILDSYEEFIKFYKCLKFTVLNQDGVEIK